jgi:hypothetical protein
VKIISERILVRALTFVVLLTILVGASPSAARPVRAAENELAVFSNISVYANIETAGVVVTGSNLPKTAELFYRLANETAWRPAHPLIRIDDGRLVGSLFGLSPSTTYNIRVFDGTSEITGSVTTQPDGLQFAPTTILRVNDDAPAGGDGSAAAPFQKIQDAINRAGPGTQVLVADGVYHEAVTFSASGTPGNWIQVKAEGSGAILDGSESLSPQVWTSHDTKAHVWVAKISGSIGYLARNEKRMYLYDDLTGLLEGRGHNGIPMDEGWYFEPATSRLYLRSGNDPYGYTWQMSRLDSAFSASGRDWLWIEGFEVRFYGREHGCGICMTNTSHIVIRANKIHNLQVGVYVDWTGGEDRGNDTRIEYNEIYDPPVNEWPWSAVKGSSMEGTAIVVRGHIGAIVRGNKIHNFFNGIYTGTSADKENPGVAFDMNIYQNHIYDISDDGLEPEGACINQRFRNNTVDRMLIGISLAPITQGPVWIMRSSFTNFTSSSFKWDLNSDGPVFIYHNTSWTNVPGLNAMSMIRPVHNSVMRNNIFQGNGYAFEESFSGSTGHDWNYDNWFTTRAGGSHFKWENITYKDMPGLCSSTGLECNGHEVSPGLTNPAGGDFSLAPLSPNIDRGVVIPGANDNFIGGAPDLGAYESGFDSQPVVVSIKRADENPSNAGLVNFTVVFSKPVTGVDVVPPFKDFNVTVSPGITSSFILNIAAVSATTFTVSVNTGSGNGTLRLDLVDDDSILDASQKPLGGAGVGNGNFNIGESYTVEKTMPAVTSIKRLDANPSTSGSVHFAVIFSQEVSGVDASDFVLTAGGGINGAGIVEVLGSGNSYSVTINAGAGDGTLRLDLLDNDSIVDAQQFPLGGPGAGNGGFTNGEVYTLDRTAPRTTDSLLADPSPTIADSVRFAVNFSEPVTGVDGSDFVPAVTGSISGAAITAINGSGSSYMVTVGTGAGDGTIRLNLVDNDSIVDMAGLPLGGLGAGNGNFSAGGEYVINKSSIVGLSKTYVSIGVNDGWVLESKEESGQGGSMNSALSYFKLGRRQQRPSISGNS